MRKCIAAGLVLLGMALVVGTGLSGGGGGKIKGQLPPQWKKLDLGKDQVIKIYTIQTKYREKIKALEVQLSELKDKQKGEMLDVLTDEQKAKLRKILLGEEKKSSTKSKEER